MKAPIVEAMPYIDSLLLPRDRFVSYCSKRGINTSNEELLKLEKYRILFPAVRVFHKIGNYQISHDVDGVASYRQATEKPSYYLYEGITYGSEGWLKDYSFVIPENEEKTLTVEINSRNYGFKSRINDEMPSMAFYMPDQIILLIKIQKKLILQTNVFDIVKSRKKVSLSRSAQKNFRWLKEEFAAHRKKFYRIMRVAYIGKEARIECEEFSNQSGHLNHKDVINTVSDLRHVDKAWESDYRTMAVSSLIKKYKVQKKEIYEVLEFLHTHAILSDPIQAWRRVLKVPLSLAGKEAGRVLYCSDYRNFLNDFEWALRDSPMLNKRISKRFRAVRRYRSCVVCNAPIDTKIRVGRPNVSTCGKPQCKAEYRKNYLRKARKDGKYKNKKEK